tara:strand:+ start:8900 stop:9022 length:123 start_codon:yes stop_codon:yes gene_type:complete
MFDTNKNFFIIKLKIINYEAFKDKVNTNLATGSLFNFFGT